MHNMPSERPSRFKWSIISVTLLALAAFGVLVRAQEATEPAAPNAAYVDDWTHHHLVFSDPGTREDAVKRGKLEKWQEITNEPRYQLQQAKRTFGTRPVVADPDLGFGPGGSWDRNPIPRRGRPPLSIFGDGVKKDWSTPLGSGAAGSVTAPIGSLSGNISSSSTFTVDGVTFDASAPTAASTEGTFSGNPSTGQTITIGTLTLTASDSTQNSQTGTFSTWPATPAASTISVTNGGNTLNMTTTGSSQSTVTSGTVTNPPAPGSTVKITSYPASGTSTTTTFTSAGTGTATINSDPGGGNQITVGNITYVWHGNCGGYSDCAVHDGNTTDDAGNLSAAINGSCGGNACAANGDVTAVASGNVVYVVNKSTSANAPFSIVSGTAIALNPASGGVLPATSSNTCGAYEPSATIATLLGNLKAAINACPAADGITVTGTPATTITVTSTYYGNTTDFPFSATGYTGLSWNAVASGSDGTNSCSSSTTGTYATSSSTTTLATNLLTALKACAAANDPTIGLNVAQTTSSTSTVTVYENTWGTGGPTVTVAPTAAGFFKWNAGTLTGGTNGATNATHFAVDNVNSDNAAALATAVADANNGVVSATHSGTNGYATVTAVAPGSSGNSVGLGGTAVGNGFSWGGGATLGTGTGGVLGSDGTTSGTNTPPTFAYWSGATYVSSSQLATNIATAVDANPTTGAIITAAETGTPSTGVSFTHYQPGTYTVAPSAFFAFNSGNSVTIPAGATATVQPNAFPAKWGASLTTASCANDFVVYPTGQPGATTAANIIAYNELYGTNTPTETGCGTPTVTVPTVYWAFNTGPGYSVTTSPILAWLDGSKVAFIQSNGTAAQLVVVKWAAGGTLGGPVTPSTANNITTCTAPCMTVTNLAYNDTYSSPYYDNSHDTIYVGDDHGNLEKFTGVFTGTANPAETEVSLNTGPYAITSPVYDSVSGCVFVGDTEGYLYSVRSGVAGGSVCTGTSFASFGRSENLGSGGANEGIFDGPLVDPVAGTVYAFVAGSGSISLTTTLNILSTPPNYNTFSVVPPGVLTSADVGQELYIDGVEVATINTVNANGQGGTLINENPIFQGVCAFLQTLPPPAPTCTDLTFTLTDTSITPGDNVVDEFLTSTITGTAATPVQAEPLGTGGAGYGLYAGTFDNVYFSSTTSAGNLYALGNTGTTGGATLYQLPITNGSIAGVISAYTGLTTTEYPWPSPATEFCNNGTSACVSNGTSTTGGTDYLFFSVNRGTSSGCNSAAGFGCISSYNVSNPASPSPAGLGLNVTTPGTNGCWATGGLVIDNSATGTAGAQEIYFVNLNGAAAGGADGTSPTSSNCTSGAGPTINAVQASQANP
jgi:hypothetical protein